MDIQADPIRSFSGFNYFQFQIKMAASNEKRDEVNNAVELENEEIEDEDNSDLYDELVESDGSDTDESIYGVCIYVLLTLLHLEPGCFVTSTFTSSTLCVSQPLN